MSLFEWCQWLQHTRLATAISESDWLFPLIEGTHILTLPLSVGMVLIFDLRLLGIAFRSEPASRIMHQCMRWSMFGFAVMFSTGGLLFISQAGKAYANPFFRTKLILLVLLGINAAVFQTMLYPKIGQWDLLGRTPPSVRFCAALSLIAWIAVIVCGRTMAYQF